MTIQINGNGTITGISVGGLPDGIVDTDMIAASAVTPAKSTITGGLSMVDQWRLSTDSGENNGYITNNWERCDTYGFGQLGTGMTESSGVFTFPSTGIYRIDAQGHSKRTDNITIPDIDFIIRASTDGSNYDSLSMSSNHIGGANNSHGVNYCSAIFDVTNVSTHKIMLYVNATHPTNFRGSTSTTKTGLMFMKLGET